MATGVDFVTTEEAARLLGVTVRRAQQMLDSGDLARVARGLVDRTSVERHLVSGKLQRTRVWAEHTARGAIALLSGERADWLGRTQTSRLRATLCEVTVGADLAVRCRERAIVRTFTGHSAVAARLRRYLVHSDRALLGLVTGLDTGVDGYLATDQVDPVARRYGLRENAAGDHMLRATGFHLDVVEHLAVTSSVLAALDAASSLDPRERSVGEEALSEALARFRS